MTTLIPRPAYTQEEIDRLYPSGLKLQLVQIVRNLVLQSLPLNYDFRSAEYFWL